MSSAPSMKLVYFNGRGLMEIPRQLLAQAGKEAGKDYEDARFMSFEEFGKAQASGELGSHNCNRVPLLVHNGVTIGQGHAINRYLATTLGLMGSNATEAAVIDMLYETCNDLNIALGKLLPYGNTFSQEEKDAKAKEYLETSADAGSDRSKRFLQWHLQHLENLVGSDGYSVGGKPSLMDARLFNMFGDTCTGFDGKTMGGSASAGASLEDVNAALKAFPKISKIVSTWAAESGVSSYLAKRGAQFF